jgi:hypothetical protein
MMQLRVTRSTAEKDTLMKQLVDTSCAIAATPSLWAAFDPWWLISLWVGSKPNSNELKCWKQTPGVPPPPTHTTCTHTPP